VARLLQQLGVQADVVADGQAALNAVAANEYALVLMDCQLPGVDGCAAAAEIRRRESASPGHTRRLPIVALTSAARDADWQRALAAGMDEHLTKPLDLERLAALLARWRLHHESPVATPDSSPIPDRPGRPPILDPAGLPIVNGRLSEPYREIVRLYQREAASRMDALGVAAALPDHAQIARIAHTLAGSSSSIGALRMAAACVTLETVAREQATNASTGSAPPSPRPSAPNGRPSGDHAGGDRALAEAAEEVRRELQALETALTHLTAERPPI
jgi:CheY-like chemotaxis protein